MNGLGVLGRMGELARGGETFALATVVWRQGPSSSKQGSRAIITTDGELHGWIGGACAEPVVIREAKQVIADGHARLLLLGSPDQFGTTVPAARPPWPARRSRRCGPGRRFARARPVRSSLLLVPPRLAGRASPGAPAGNRTHPVGR